MKMELMKINSIFFIYNKMDYSFLIQKYENINMKKNITTKFQDFKDR